MVTSAKQRLAAVQGDRELAPIGNAVVSPYATVATAVAAASSAAVATGSAGTQGFVLSVVASTNCHIRFGSSAVAAATTSDRYIPAGVPHRFYVDSTTTHFRVIRATADGTLYTQRSSDPA